MTSRFPTPGKLGALSVIAGEMRFINNKGFSTRYRNRLQVERDFDPGRFR